MTRERAAAHVDELMANYPDFPSPGILFRDLTPVFADADAFRSIVDTLATDHDDSRCVAVAGVEARGFILAAAVAYSRRRGVLAVRKSGKLPGHVVSERYDLEYGSAELELQPHTLPSGSRVTLVDDLLATGGTLAAAANLLERSGYIIDGISVVLELEGLGGRARLSGYPVRSIATR